MAKLPDRNVLGSRPPSYVGGQADYGNLAQQQYYTGVAIRGFGDAIERAGATVGRAFEKQQEAQDKVEAFNADTARIGFETTQNQSFDDALQNMKPGAEGFTNEVMSRYDQAAKSFILSQPESQRPELDRRLYAKRASFLDAAKRAEQKEVRRYGEARLEDGLNTLTNRVVAEPAALSSAQDDGIGLIDTLPGLTEIERDGLRRNWRQRVQETALLSEAQMDPLGTARRLRGVTPSDSGPQVTPFVKLSERATRAEYEGVDPRLRTVMELAAQRMGVQIEIRSGAEDRGGGRGYHPHGQAVDVWLLDASGNRVEHGAGGTGDRPELASSKAGAAKNFHSYEALAHTAYRVARELYPDMPFRWGGYFSGGPDKYGSLDTMHFDVGTEGMAGGSFEAGLSEETRQAWAAAGFQIPTTSAPPGIGPANAGRVITAGPVSEVDLLNVIGSSESDNRYNVVYGGKTFDSYADHPRQAVTIVSGPNKGQKTTAAGRYQFTADTWDEAAAALGLTDFSPESQDRAALWLARKEYKAKTGRELDEALAAGDIRGVASALSGRWTSLPGGIEERGDGAMQLPAGYEDVRPEIFMRVMQRAAAAETQEVKQRVEINREELTTSLVRDYPDDYGAVLDDMVENKQITKTEASIVRRETGKRVEVARTAARVDAGEPFDPYSPDDRKAVNNLVAANPQFYDAVLSGDERTTAAAVQIVNRSGIIPTDLRRATMSLIRSKDPAEVERGVALASSIESASPQAYNSNPNSGGLSQDDREWIAVARSAARSVKPEDLPKEVHDRFDPSKAEQRKKVEKIVKADLKDFGAEDILAGFDDSMWTSAPTATDTQMETIEADYKEAYARNIARGVPAKEAHEEALKATKSRWSVSRATGQPRLMMLPPEQILPAIGGSHEWVSKEVQSVVGDDVPADDIFLVTTSRTLKAHAAGQMPTWKLVVREESGIFSDRGDIKFTKTDYMRHYLPWRERVGQTEDTVERMDQPPQIGLTRAVEAAQGRQQSGAFMDYLQQQRRLPASAMGEDPEGFMALIDEAIAAHTPAPLAQPQAPEAAPAPTPTAATLRRQSRGVQ